MVTISDDAVVTNTSSSGNSNGHAIFSSSASGIMNINGGTVSTTEPNSFAIRSTNLMVVNLNNSPVINGRIFTNSTTAEGRLTMGDSFAPNGIYTVDISTYTLNTIVVTGGANFASSFALPQNRLDTGWILQAVGDDLLLRN